MVDFSSNILGYSKQSEDSRSVLAFPSQRSSSNKVQPDLGVLSFLGSFKARKFGMGFFGSLIFGPGIFLGFCLRP